MNHTKSTYRLARISMLVTMATVLHILEGLLPSLSVPGARLGLANIITLTAILCFGAKEALAVVICRVLLGSLFGPGLVSIGAAMSLAGGVVSWAFMSAARRLWTRHFNLVGLSLLGAVSHNLAQLAVACVYLEEIAIISLLPMLMIFALPTGIMIGLASGQLNRALGAIQFFQSEERP